MTGEEYLDHGMGGGDPDYGPPEPPDHYPVCPECDHVVRPEAITADGPCEDCAAVSAEAERP